MPQFTLLADFKDIPWRKILPTFLAIALSLITCFSILIFVHTREALRYNLSLIRYDQQAHLDLGQKLIQEKLRRISKELLTFAHAPGILALAANPQDPASQQRSIEGLTNFIENRGGYDQFRIWDTSGRELLRMEKRAEKAVVIFPRELKTTLKDNPFYGKLDIQDRGRIFISPMNLARDHKGKVLEPFHPQLEMATPIFDRQNRPVGTVQFTYQGQDLFDLFTQATTHRHNLKNQFNNSIEIVNQEGYWLLAADKADEWGYIRNSQRRFSQRFPQIWNTILAQREGQIETADGLLSFTTMSLGMDQKILNRNSHPNPAEFNSQAGQDGSPFWILISLVSQTELASLNYETQRFHLILYLIVLIISLPLALWISLLRQKEQESKKKLQTQKERFRLLYDKAPLPYQALDPEGRILDINQAWLTTLGYPRDDVTGRIFADFIVPESLAQFQDFLYLLTEKNQRKYCELELVKKDGSTLLVSLYSDHISDVQGEARQIHCILNDITELQAEKKRTAHLAILLQTIIQIHRLIGQENERQSLVQRCCDTLVKSRGYGSAWCFLLDSNEQVTISAEAGLLHDSNEIRRQINRGNPPTCIRECRKRQGIVAIDTPTDFCSTCPMSTGYPRAGIICAPVAHATNIYGYLNASLPIDFIKDQEEKDRFSEIARDIGYALFNLDQQEKKLKTESALLQSEERLRGITDSVQDAIMMMDPQGAISFWNPASEKIFGYCAAEALGKDLHTLLAPLRFHAAHQAALPEFSRSGHGKAIGKTLELSALHKDGREIPILLSLSAVFQDEGWHAVGIVHDMTERKLMEEQMLQSEKMTIIAGLAAGVAHEINTPLSAILQSIQVIHQSLSPDLARNQEIAGHCGLDLASVQDYFEKREINFFMDGIKESAIKSSKIITNLLQFSRPRKMEIASMDIALLLDKSVELAKNDYTLRKQYDIFNIEIIRDYAPNLPQVSCVAMEIEQVFINLLKNAVQAMRDLPEPKAKGQLILRVQPHGEMIRIEITDNGPGINAETRLHIFDPFFTTKDIGAGTGLGLSVSYTIIVTKHKGQLSVHSVPGQGTTFTIDLPLG